MVLYFASPPCFSRYYIIEGTIVNLPYDLVRTILFFITLYTGFYILVGTTNEIFGIVYFRGYYIEVVPGLEGTILRSPGF